MPWKYGFKSIKSIVRIRLTDGRAAHDLEDAVPSEYGFYSNVNPAVDIRGGARPPSAASASSGGGPTLPFNGYGDEVAQLYAGLDLKKLY